MAASVHRLQLVHSATSMIMFHFFIVELRRACTYAAASRTGYSAGVELGDRPRMVSWRYPRDRSPKCTRSPVPQFDLDKRLGTCERVGRFRLRPMRHQQIDGAAAIDRLARLAERIVDRRGLEAVGDAARQPLGQHRGADDCATVVIDLDEIVLLDAAVGGVLRAEADDPVIIAVDLHPVIGNVEQERILAVTLRVEAVLAVRRQKLQRVFLHEIARMRPLP